MNRHIADLVDEAMKKPSKVPSLSFAYILHNLLNYDSTGFHTFYQSLDPIYFLLIW